MNCPKCSSESTKVNGSKNGRNGWVRRRRTCLDCGEKFSTLELREDELKKLEVGSLSNDLRDSEESNGSNPLMSIMSGLNKKLNIIARNMAAQAEKSHTGIQSKKKSRTKSVNQGFEEYEKSIQSYLVDIEEDPDPDDIHAWAVLLANMEN